MPLGAGGSGDPEHPLPQGCSHHPGTGASVHPPHPAGPCSLAPTHVVRLPHQPLLVVEDVPDAAHQLHGAPVIRVLWGERGLSRVRGRDTPRPCSTHPRPPLTCSCVA